MNTILFFGNERLATGVTTNADCLQGLINASYKVAAVILAQNERSASRKNTLLEVETVAAENNIPVLTPSSLEGFGSELLAYQAQAGVLVAYGKIVPKEIIDLLPSGIVNLHPSLLPKHRGPTPLESVILAGEEVSGVSIMQLGAGLDNGPVYAQAKVSLSGRESKQELANMLLAEGSKLLINSLPAILDGSLRPVQQNEKEATYDKKVSKQDSQLDFSKPGIILEREIRAYAGWPRSRAIINGLEVVVTAAHQETGSGQPGRWFSENSSLKVFSADGVLVIDSLVPSGKKEMSAQAFLAGYKI